MAVDTLLARLDGLRQTAPDRWIAKCPAHEDRSPSLSVRETDDGRVLAHCFAGCTVHDIVVAVGLELADLFPDKPTHARQGKPNHWHAARDALRALRMECLVVAIAAENVAAGVSLTENDRGRLTQAAIRIRTAAEVCA